MPLEKVRCIDKYELLVCIYYIPYIVIVKNASHHVIMNDLVATRLLAPSHAVYMHVYAHPVLFSYAMKIIRIHITHDTHTHIHPQIQNRIGLDDDAHV